MTAEELTKEYLKDESKWLVEDAEGNLINITKKVEAAYRAGLEKGLEKGREQARSQMMAELGDAMQTWR